MCFNITKISLNFIFAPVTKQRRMLAIFSCFNTNSYYNVKCNTVIKNLSMKCKMADAIVSIFSAYIFQNLAEMCCILSDQIGNILHFLVV